jgi:glutathione synthase/RimK-type ligase-like ATP-grasp enzyme
MTRVAFATCAELLVLDPDDELLAQALRELGVEVVPLAWDDGRADWASFDLVLVRSPWDYHLRRDAFVHWAQRVGRETRLLNGAATIAWNTDKTYLRALAEQGVPTVPTAWVERVAAGGDAPDLAALLAERGWAGEEAIVKPSIGLGSSGLMRVPAGDPGGAGQRHVAELAQDGVAMVQPFIPSVPAAGELSLIFFERELSHVVRKRPPAGEFRVQPDFGAVTTAEEATAQERDVAQRALACVAEAELLYARVDLVAGPAGEVWLMELELVEPTLYFEAAPGSAARFAPLVAAAAGAKP